MDGTPFLGPPDPEDLKDGPELGDTDEARPATSVELTADEIHCLTCAMAGNFPSRFEPIRMTLLRKLARASREATAAEPAAPSESWKACRACQPKVACPDHAAEAAAFYAT
jgi:hypothetical protein